MAIPLQTATLLLERLKAYSDGRVLATPLEFLCSLYDDLSSSSRDGVGNFLRQVKIDGMYISDIFESALIQVPELQNYEFRWHDLNILFLVPKVLIKPKVSLNFFQPKAIRIDIANREYDVRTADILEKIDCDVPFPAPRGYFGVGNALHRDVALAFKKYLNRPTFAGRISLLRISLKCDGNKHLLRQIFTAFTVKQSRLENIVHHYDSEVMRYLKDFLRTEKENQARAQWRAENCENFIIQTRETIAMLEKIGFSHAWREYWE